jgi:hypothetical protein
MIVITMTIDGTTHIEDMTTDEIHIETHRDAITGNTIVRAAVIAGRRLAIERHGGLANVGERVADRAVTSGAYPERIQDCSGYIPG